jgi:hypothetical protein
LPRYTPAGRRIGQSWGLGATVPCRGSQVRSRLAGGAEWIRTSSSALDRHQFEVSSEFGRSTGTRSSERCRPRRTDRVVGRGPERRHSPAGSDGVTPRSRCQRCERVAGAKRRVSWCHVGIPPGLLPNTPMSIRSSRSLLPRVGAA